MLKLTVYVQTTFPWEEFSKEIPDNTPETLYELLAKGILYENDFIQTGNWCFDIHKVPNKEN